jgi:hypothetical protein
MNGSIYYFGYASIIKWVFSQPPVYSAILFQIALTLKISPCLDKDRYTHTFIMLFFVLLLLKKTDRTIA